MRSELLAISFLCLPFLLLAQDIKQPPQPAHGPGGMRYAHTDVTMLDFAEDPDGYWLFLPASPQPAEAPVVVFLHGYGGYNPMIYGKWIKHLVRQGNVVIYPRYQKNMMSPKPDDFADNVAQGIRDALVYLTTESPVRPTHLDHLPYVGHSYGGVIACDLAIHHEEQGLPPSSVIMMCAPGTSWMKGGRLEHYEALPSNLLLLAVVSVDDETTGDEFANKVFNEAIQVKDRNLLRQYPDHHGKPAITAGHNQSYSVDLEFDAGFRNYTSRRALRISTLDPMDYYGYWKWFDALLDCSHNGTHCELVFGATPEQVSMGNWSDGTPIRPVEVVLPAELLEDSPLPNMAGQR